MAAAKTEGNPVITHGDDDEWIANTLTRIDANLAAFGKRLDHLDELAHRIDQSLEPLREHADAIGRGVRMLDRTPGWLRGGKGGKV